MRLETILRRYKRDLLVLSTVLVGSLEISTPRFTKRPRAAVNTASGNVDPSSKFIWSGSLMVDTAGAILY